MEKRDDQFLNDFIEKNDGLLKERWQSAMGHLTQRLSQFTPESRVFNEVKKLILNLVSLVQSTGSAEQAVDLELKPIVSQLRALQSENQLTHAEMVLFLFFARDFLKDILKDLVGSTPQGGKSDPPFVEGLNQVSLLLNRLGLVFFENTMRLKDEEWEQVLAVDLTAAFRLTRAAVRGMMRRRFGRIIAITSVVGVTGNAGQANYAAAKSGLIGMTKSLAQEVASRGITVNAIAPGFIETAMTSALTDKQKDLILTRVPAGRLGSPEDVAAAAVYLASNEGAYVTGQTLHVNGGMAMI